MQSHLLRCRLHMRQALVWSPSLTHPALRSPHPPRAQALSPGSDDAAARQQALERVQEVLSEIDDVQPFGSCVSGLHLPEGDLDMSIEGEPCW